MNLPDQFNDPGYGNLTALLKTHPSAYEFVKEASLEESNADLPDTAFAWESRRLYPIHDPQSAVLSALYTKVAGERVPTEVLMKIAEACSVYGVGHLVPTDTTKLAAEDVPEEEYIFPERQLYRVKTAEELRVAEMHLLAQAPKLLPSDRAGAFVRLYKRASALGQPLQNTRSYQYAGLVQTDLQELKSHIRARGSIVKSAEARDLFDKLADVVSQYPRTLVDRGTQVKLAQTLADFDSGCKLETHYDRDLLDPLLTVFNTTRLNKQSDEQIQLGGDVFPLTQLAGISAKFYADVLGPDILDQIQTAPGGTADPQALAQILPTLPADMKELLGQKLRESLG